MLEATGNILSTEILSVADAVCVTTNGIVKSDGRLVMGAGVALAFANKWPELSRDLGGFVEDEGNIVNYVEYLNCPMIISFPTKHHYREGSDIGLIKRSALQLMEIIEEFQLSRVYLPRPGTGLGKLSWETVRKAISSLLDNRVTVISL